MTNESTIRFRRLQVLSNSSSLTSHLVMASFKTFVSRHRFKLSLLHRFRSTNELGECVSGKIPSVHKPLFLSTIFQDDVTITKLRLGFLTDFFDDFVYSYCINAMLMINHLCIQLFLPAFNIRVKSYQTLMVLHCT